MTFPPAPIRPLESPPFFNVKARQDYLQSPAATNPAQ